jgi:hypothetical protein
MSVTRIYMITHNQTNDVRLIDASSQSQAVRHAAKADYAVKVAAPKDVAHYMRGGVEVEQVDPEPEQIDPPLATDPE